MDNKSKQVFKSLHILQVSFDSTQSVPSDSCYLAYGRVASVSVRFRRKQRGTRVKDRTKNGASKREGRSSRSIFRAAKTEIPVPRYFCAPKQNGNAC